MKIKRNKRVEQNLKIRTARSSGKEHTPALSWRRLRAALGVPSRKPRSFMALLEQDMAAQAERLQQFERAVGAGLDQAELAWIPVVEPASDMPIAEAPGAGEPAAGGEEAGMQSPGGRTNYQYVSSSARVRRRIIS